MSKLLLLDINGLLCCKTNQNETNLSSIHLKAYHVILRPYYKEFLDFCYKHFNVGFFTSTTEKNAKIILNNLLTEEQIKNTKLMWFRDRTHLDYESYKTFNTIKKLNDIYDYPLFNCQYHEHNTILIDDSFNKVRYNEPKNIIICNAFHGDHNDTHLIELIHKIVEQFELIK